MQQQSSQIDKYIDRLDVLVRQMDRQIELDQIRLDVLVRQIDRVGLDQMFWIDRLIDILDRQIDRYSGQIDRQNCEELIIQSFGRYNNSRSY